MLRANADPLMHPSSNPGRRITWSGHTEPERAWASGDSTTTPTNNMTRAGTSPAAGSARVISIPASPMLVPTTAANPMTRLRKTSPSLGNPSPLDSSTTAGTANSTPSSSTVARRWPTNGPRSVGTAIMVNPKPGANTATGPRAIP